jgi:hypothetical protein
MNSNDRLRDEAAPAREGASHDRPPSSASGAESGFGGSGSIQFRALLLPGEGGGHGLLQRGSAEV